MKPKIIRNLIVTISLILIVTAFVHFEGPYLFGFLKTREEVVDVKKRQMIHSEPKVALVQSSKEQADDLNYEEIKSMVAEAVKYAGGLGDIVHNGDVVVLKPNIMCLWVVSTGERLPPNVNGITTDWRVVKAASELVREINPNGKIYVMESSAFQVTRMAMDSLNYTKEFMPEVDEFVCLDESGGYEEYNSPKLVKVILPKGIGTYPDFMKPNKSPEFYMNKQYYEADVLIALPVLKNHHYTGLTGAVKVVGMGSSPSNIYGSYLETFATSGATRKILSNMVLDKSTPVQIHLERSGKINHAPLFLDMWLSDYYMCKPVDFVITDGLNGIENGPDLPGTCKAGNRKDNLMNMRLILAGKDAIAVDVIHSLIIGIDPYLVGHLVLLSNKNMGQINPKYIRVVGNRRVDEVKKPFKLNWQQGLVKTYTLFSPPKMVVNGLKIQNREIHMSLEVNKSNFSSGGVIKMEVAVDGRMLDRIVTDGFENIILDIGRLDQGEHVVSIYGYDRFLNCNEQKFNVRI